MRKVIYVFLLVVLPMLFACGSGSGGGGGSDDGVAETVTLSFDVVSDDGRVVSKSSKSISATGTNPLPDAKYYYKATPKWDSKDSTEKIAGATSGFVLFNPATFSDRFALGNWEFEIEIRADSTNGVVLYKTDPAINQYINANTNTIPVTVTKQFNGTGTVTVDIYAPTIAQDEKVTFYYGKVGAPENWEQLAGTKITSGPYAGFTEFKYKNSSTGDKLSVPAGLYVFRAIYDYTYVDNENASHTVSVENGSVTTCEVFGDGEVAITGTIEGNQNVVASFNLNGVNAIGVTVKAVASATDDTEVTSIAINAGGSRVFKAIPTTGQETGKSWITYVEPDTYQWYVNGVAVTSGVSGEHGEYFTFSTSTDTIPNTSYVYCIATKKNSSNAVEYAVGAGKVIVVRPN